MVRATANISMAGLEFPHFNEVECESSWQMLTDTCTVKIPRGLLVDKKPLKSALKVRDKVSIDLGYNGHNDRVFTGVIAKSLSPSVPVEVYCEDGMFLLKQTRATHQFTNASLKDIVEHVAPGIDIKVLDAAIGKYTIPNDWNAAKVFNDLKSNRGLFAFFRDGKLQVGLQYDPNYAKVKTFDFEASGADDVGYIIEEETDLEFFTKDDLRLKVKAISIGKNNKKTTVEVGDAEGESRTMHFYDLSEKELKAAAERELERMRYDGYRGSFTTFGKPFVRHGDIVKLIDRRYDRAGNYWVDKVKYSMTLTGGYRQEIHLGPIT